MTALLAVLAALALFVLYGVAAHLDRRVAKHGPHVLISRWALASAWHGNAITNRGWTRPGTKALTKTGFAHRRWYWPRWQHAVWRLQWTIVVLVTSAALVLRPGRAVAYLGVSALLGAGYGARRGRVRLLEYSHRKSYVKPLHVRLHAKAGIPLAHKPEAWLDVPRDLSYARLTWPKGAHIPEPQDRQAIEGIAASTLGMKSPRSTWQFTGARMSLRLVPPVSPPKRVFLTSVEWGSRAPDGVAEDAMVRAIREAGVDDLVLGIGEEGRIVKVSLKLDSPHIAVSVDTGGGKSVLVRCLMSQVLLRGGIGAILDNKLVSHPSLRNLPNVAYADDVEKIHDFLEWLDGELSTRSQFIRAHTDFHGNLTGSPGPRLVVFLEEQNLLMNRLRSYWSERISEDKSRPKEDREFLPSVSPAIRGFENASYVGRELGVHLVFISQRFTAEAAGGGSKGAAIRMNTGVRVLAGYDDDTWKMLVGKGTPMPSPSRQPGRMQVYVKGAGVTEVQVAFFTHDETRQFAESGTARVPRKIRHLTEFRAAGVADPGPSPRPVHVAGSDGTAIIITPEPAAPAHAALPQPPVRNWMTIQQAREAGMLPRTWVNPAAAFRTAKSKAKKAGRAVPEVRGYQGNRALYDAVELADFLESLTLERA